MNIWTFIETNSLPEHGHFTRHYNLGKGIAACGNKPVVFVGSHPHNTNIQLIKDRSKFQVFQTNPFPWVLVKTLNYKNRIERIISMFLFNINASKAAKEIYKINKPDYIIASSPQPIELFLAFKFARKYKCKSILEIRDLWPESLISYGEINNNFLVYILRKIEKYIYVKSDYVMFLMEGGYEYIKERKWDDVLPREKFININNGVNVSEFNENKDKYQIYDEDLESQDIYKVIYTGSIRKVNNLQVLLEAAKRIKNKKVKILIWGDGNEYEKLYTKIKQERIENVVLKGRIEKKYIPYILSKADINIAHNTSTNLFRFGISFNKIFEYFAAGKPIFVDFPSKFNPVIEEGAGFDIFKQTPEIIANKIDEISKIDKMTYDKYCGNALAAAKKYDFNRLAMDLVDGLK